MCVNAQGGWGVERDGKREREREKERQRIFVLPAQSLLGKLDLMVPELKSRGGHLTN